MNTSQTHRSEKPGISNLVAEEMNNFAKLMEEEVPVFANSYSSGVKAFTRAFILSKEIGTENRDDIEVAKNSVQEFKDTISVTQSQMLYFRQIIANLPKVTTILNRAKKRVVFVLDKMDEEQKTALNLTFEIEKALNQILED